MESQQLSLLPAEAAGARPGDLGFSARYFRVVFNQMTLYERAECKRVVRRLARTGGSVQRGLVREVLFALVWTSFERAKRMTNSAEQVSDQVRAELGALWGTGPDTIDRAVWDATALGLLEFRSEWTFEDGPHGVPVVRKTPREIWPGTELLLALDAIKAAVVRRLERGHTIARDQFPQKSGGTCLGGFEDPSESDSGGTDGPPIDAAECPF